MRLIPDGEIVRLSEMDPGLFLFNDCLALKTEYMSNSGRIEAYIVHTGEFFHGGTKTAEDQRSLMVQPLKIVEVVRCKDCLHKRKYGRKPPECYCMLYVRTTREDGFCYRGEPMPENKQQAYQLYGKEK